MKTQAAIKKINTRAKKVGVKVDILAPSPNDSRNAYYAEFEGSGQTISFHGSLNGRDEIHLIKVTRHGDVSDPHTDYFAGSFVENITQALNWVAPLPPKYPAGSLVRFKDNKRNIRSNVNGKLALVTKARPLQVEFVGESKPNKYILTYSERDVEIAK